MARKYLVPYPRQPGNCFSGLNWEKREFNYIPIPTFFHEPQYSDGRNYYRARFAYLAHIGRPLYKQILKSYMPTTRRRAAWATYMSLAINGNANRMFDKTSVVLWGGTLPELDFVAKSYDITIQGYDFTWTRPTGFLTISNIRVMAFLYRWDSGLVYPAFQSEPIYTQSIHVSAPDLDGRSGVVYVAFIYQWQNGRIGAISPANICRGTGWYWREQSP